MLVLLVLFARSRHRNATNLSREPFFSLSLSQEQQQLFFFLAFVCDVYLLLFLKNKKVKNCPVFTFYISLFCCCTSRFARFFLSLSRLNFLIPFLFYIVNTASNFIRFPYEREDHPSLRQYSTKRRSVPRECIHTRGFSPETPLKTSIIRAYVFDALPFSFFFFLLFFLRLFFGRSEKRQLLHANTQRRRRRKKKGDVRRVTLSLSL